MTPLASEGEDERSRKRSRPDDDDDDEEAGDGMEVEDISRHGKKPGGKSAGKGTKPRTVVRGVRGLVPMEVDKDGNQHVGGRLPESAIAEDGGEAVVIDDDEDEEEDIPLAKRPQLDEGERRRREVIKEKEREREEEVVRRMTKGVNAEDAGRDLSGQEIPAGVDVWEGVELVRLIFSLLSPKTTDVLQVQLPPRPAAIEQSRREIILPIVSSRNPDEKDTILLIGLKNLFQRQLPKMPREYITRLVLDKNHISMAIVKRGWKVVGGICYRPFVGRNFAEIVFCAVDSSEQIKVCLFVLSMCPHKLI
jgi:histone acetyltransferase